MRNIVASLVLLFVLSCSGCKTAVVRSEAELFYRCHPELRARFVRLSPTDATTLREQAARRLNTWERAREFVEKHTSPQTDLSKELEWNKGFGKAVYQDAIDVVRALEAAQARFGGQIYRYGCQGPGEVDDGYLLLSGGEIREKIPTGTTPKGRR